MVLGSSSLDPRRLAVGVDGTPLFGSRTGIGHYTARLLAGLARRPELEITAVPFTARGGGRPADLDPGVSWRRVPAPARVLQRLWSIGPLPPVELFAGAVDIFHGTNFVLPPAVRAAGVVTVHDLSFLRYPELVSAASLAYRTLVPRSVARASVVLTPSAAIAGELIDAYRLDPARVLPTPLGVDESWATATPPTPGQRARLGLPARYLLAVGTFEPRKGLDVLMRAYRLLLTERPDSPPLVLIGPRGWGPKLDLAGLMSEQVICPGYVAYDQLQSVVAGASVFVFPSRYEGFGLPPLEAMAAGVPVVATGIATSREVLGGHAALAAVDDAVDLAEVVARTLDRPPGLAESAAARAHARSWTWERCVAETIRGYRLATG